MIGARICVLMFVSSSWLKFEGGLLCLLNLEWGSPILVVVLFALVIRIDCCDELFSEVRDTGAYKVRPGGFRRSEGRRRSRCVGSPLRAVTPFVSAAKCCGDIV